MAIIGLSANLLIRDTLLLYQWFENKLLAMNATKSIQCHWKGGLVGY